MIQRSILKQFFPFLQRKREKQQKKPEAKGGLSLLPVIFSTVRQAAILKSWFPRQVYKDSTGVNIKRLSELCFGQLHTLGLLPFYCSRLHLARRNALSTKQLRRACFTKQLQATFSEHWRIPNSSFIPLVHFELHGISFLYIVSPSLFFFYLSLVSAVVISHINLQPLISSPHLFSLSSFYPSICLFLMCFWIPLCLFPSPISYHFLTFSSTFFLFKSIF